jgi:hypothetical protein
MGITKEQVEEWLQTEEGSAWLEEKKQPLINKRDELLQKVKSLTGDLQQATQSADGANDLLQRERDAVKKLVVDHRLESLMDEARVNPSLKNALRTKLENEYTFEVKADGQDRYAVVKDSEGNENRLDEFMKNWADTQQNEEAKSWLMAPHNTGGGARNDSPSSSRSSEEEEFVKALSERM